MKIKNETTSISPLHYNSVHDSIRCPGFYFHYYNYYRFFFFRITNKNILSTRNIIYRKWTEICKIRAKKKDEKSQKWYINNKIIVRRKATTQKTIGLHYWKWIQLFYCISKCYYDAYICISCYQLHKFIYIKTLFW